MTQSPTPPEFTGSAEEQLSTLRKNLHAVGVPPEDVDYFLGRHEWRARVLLFIAGILERKALPIPNVVQTHGEKENAVTITPEHIPSLVRNIRSYAARLLITQIRSPEELEKDRLETIGFVEEIIRRMKIRAPLKGRDANRPLESLPEKNRGGEVDEVLFQKGSLNLSEGNSLQPITLERWRTFVESILRLTEFHREISPQNRRIKELWNTVEIIRSIAQDNEDIMKASPEKFDEMLGMFFSLCDDMTKKIPPLFDGGSSFPQVREALIECKTRFRQEFDDSIGPIQRERRINDQMEVQLNHIKTRLINEDQPYEYGFLDLIELIRKLMKECSAALAGKESDPESAWRPFSDLGTAFTNLRNVSEAIESELRQIYASFEAMGLFMGPEKKIIVGGKLVSNRSIAESLARMIELFAKLNCKERMAPRSENDRGRGGAAKKVSLLGAINATYDPTWGSIREHRSIGEVVETQVGNSVRSKIAEVVRLLNGIPLDEIKTFAEDFTTHVQPGVHALFVESLKEKFCVGMFKFRDFFLIRAALSLTVADPRAVFPEDHYREEMFGSANAEDVRKIIAMATLLRMHFESVYFTTQLLEGVRFSPDNFPQLSRTLALSFLDAPDPMGRAEMERILIYFEDLFYHLKPLIAQFAGHSKLRFQDAQRISEPLRNLEEELSSFVSLRSRAAAIIGQPSWFDRLLTINLDYCFSEPGEGDGAMQEFLKGKNIPPEGRKQHEAEIKNHVEHCGHISGEKRNEYAAQMLLLSQRIEHKLTRIWEAMESIYGSLFIMPVDARMRAFSTSLDSDRSKTSREEAPSGSSIFAELRDEMAEEERGGRDGKTPKT